MSTNTKIALASITLIVASIAGNILSLGKEMVVASRFGIQADMDAYCAAMTVASLFNGILLSLMGSIFMPVFIKYRKKNVQQAQSYASTIITILVAGLVVVSAGLYIGAPYIIHLGFHGLSTGTAATAVRLLRYISGTVIVSGLVNVFSIVLNSCEEFVWPSFSQMLITISTIVFLVFYRPQWGISVLVYGLACGLVLQLLLLSMAVYKEGFRYTIQFDLRHPAMKETGQLLSVLILAVITAQANSIVDKIMASYLVPGSIAALGYADKLIQAPLFIFSGSIATAVLPYFSLQAAENRFHELRDSVAKSIRMAGLIFIPMTVLMIVFARPLTRILFQRGAFTEEATSLISAILVCYSFQFLFYATGTVIARSLNALQDARTILASSLLSVTLNVALNLILVRIVRPPAAGIAISTSLVYAFVAVFLFFALRRKIGSLQESYILQGLLKTGVSAAVMGCVVGVILGQFSGTAAGYAPLGGRILKYGAAGGAGLSVYAAFCLVLKVEEMGKIRQMIIKWFAPAVRHAE